MTKKRLEEKEMYCRLISQVGGAKVENVVNELGADNQSIIVSSTFSA
jgi:hypothetical protein